MYWKKKRTHTFWLNIPKFPYEKEIQTEVCGRTNSQMVGGKRLIVRNTCALILTSNNQRTCGIDYSPSNTAIETGTIETEQRKPPKLAENTAIKYWILPEFYDLNFNSMLFLRFFVATLLCAFYSWSQRLLDYTCFGYVWNIYMRFGFPRLVCCCGQKNRTIKTSTTRRNVCTWNSSKTHKTQSPIINSVFSKMRRCDDELTPNEWTIKS